MNLVYRIGLCVWFFVWIISASGQYSFNHFTDDKGLPSNSVSALLKDRKGFVWVATNKGICRFDGRDFLYFTPERDNFPDLSQSDEFEIYEDRQGIIWIGTKDQGLYCYDQDLKKHIHFQHSANNPGSLADDFVNFIFEDINGNLWIGSHSNGLNLYNRKNNSFSNLKPSLSLPNYNPRMIDDLISVAQDPGKDNVLWLGSLGGLLSYNTEEQIWTYFPLEKQTAINPEYYSGSEKFIRSMVFDGAGNMWAGTWGGGLIRFEPQTGKFEIFKYEPIQPVNGFRNHIKQMKWKSPEEIWLVAPYRGLGIFNIQTKTFRFLDSSETGEPKVVNPTFILMDELGFMWLASSTSGLYTTNLKAAVFNKVALPYSLRKIVTDPSTGKFLASTSLSNSQLLEIDPKTHDFTAYSYQPLQDKNENYILEIIPAKDRVWIMESFNLYFFNGSSIQAFTDFNPEEVASYKQSQPFFISGLYHPSGDLWLGTKFHGLFRINLETRKYKNYYYKEAESSSPGFEEFVYCLFLDNEGRVWYGSEGFGYFDYTNEKFVNLSSDRDFPESAIKIKSVQSILEDKAGNMWLGTEKNGIAVVHAGLQKLSLLKSYTTKNGMGSNDIHWMVLDHSGNIWVITGDGLSRVFTGSDLVENYGYLDGLQFLRSLYVTSDNEILIGSNQGYYCFNPDSIRPFRYPVTPYIRSFSIFDDPVDFNKVLDSDGKIRLNYDQNFFSIEFGLIDYFNPLNRPFSYMLEGIDNSWQTSLNRNYLSYANLAGGNYTFKLKAPGSSELLLPIFIETPFWKTGWFYVLIVVIVFAGFFGFYSYRLRLIRKQESLKTNYDRMINQLEMKALRAQMNPHFLFNSLNSIRYYILKEEFENASDYITKFSKLLRLILHNSRQNMITLREELDTLRIYIEFEQMRFSKNFTYEESITSAVNLDSTMIQPMTLQPFVENAIWHGLMPKEKSRVLKLKVERANGLLTVTIEDNGVGRQKAASMKSSGEMRETKSYGLQITGERFAMLRNIRGKRSDFEITDLFDDEERPAGTRVTIYYDI